MNKDKELRKWINSGLDVTPYLDFKPGQIRQIRLGLTSGVPLIYAKKSYAAKDMSLIRQGLELGVTEEQLEGLKMSQIFFVVKSKYRGLDVDVAREWVKNRSFKAEVADKMIDLMLWGVELRDYGVDNDSESIKRLHSIIEVQKVLNIPQEEIEIRTKSLSKIIKKEFKDLSIRETISLLIQK